MPRIAFLVFSIGLFLPALAAAAPRADDPRPNVILIMADDLGYETIGANGGTSWKTPVLDKLAAEGARFTKCYAQPLCTPTRVQLMTGRSNIRNYVRFDYLDPAAVTFGQLFKQAGYKTCIAGKWQLGREPKLPQHFGFDEHCLWQHTRRPPRYANPGLEIDGERKDFTNGEYGPDLVNDYVLNFIERRKDEPFFVYYPLMLTHSPFQPTPDSPDWNPRAMGEKVAEHEKHFGEMVTYMDKLLGKLVAKLKALELHDDTLVIFLGDNGTGARAASMMGDRRIVGGKGKTNEFGMHVPLIVSRPGTVGPGIVCDDLVDTTDFLPTILAAAGIAPPADLMFDGRSFLPQTQGKPGEPREWIYAWYSPRQLPKKEMNVREFAFDHRYKLYRDGKLFDHAADPEESRPLAAASLSAEAVAASKRLQAALDRFKDARPAELDERFRQAAKKVPD